VLDHVEVLQRAEEQRQKLVWVLLDRCIDLAAERDALRSEVAKFRSRDAALGRAVREWVCPGCHTGCTPDARES
jgi:hypothetical protein